MNLLVRADASIAMGTGHVMRCLALAQAWQDAGGDAVFALAESTPAISEKLLAESCRVLDISATAGTQQDADQTIAFAREQGARWVVADGYQFSAEYQRALKAAGLKLLVIDDYGHAGHYSADLVLNQNLPPNDLSYGDSLYADHEANTRLLLGLRYCLLRREFRAWQDYRRQIPDIGQRVLITLGGSDPENLTARALQAVGGVRHKNLDVTVVVGGSNPHFGSLQRLAGKLESEHGVKITLQKNVANMPELMAQSDVAISAAGSTSWELCFLALPALLIDVAENQTALAKELSRRGCAIHLGDDSVSVDKIAEHLDALLQSHSLRQDMAQRSRQLVDGNGAGRVVSVLCGGRWDNLRQDGNLRLRRAQPEDSRLLWEWANDPEVRATSFSPAPIPWETHVAWLAEKLGKNASLLLIAEHKKTPCGQVRFDCGRDGEWEIDVSVAKLSRGQGLGSRLIKLAVQALREWHPDARIHAFVKPTNAASSQAFENADFKRIGPEEVRGNAAIHFVCGETESRRSPV